MPLPFKQPPLSLCLLRLSAIGDICHMLPIVHTLQKSWPTTQLSWVIGKNEYELVKDLKKINFIIFDKSNELKSYWHLYKQLKAMRFDALLHMQMSFRTSLISLLVKADIKLGFDKQRAKDYQWLFTNKKISYQPRQHVIDSLFGFTETLGIKQHCYEWQLAVHSNELDHVLKKANLSLDYKKPYVVISPCSSMAYRNWDSQSYAAVADYIQENYHIPVVLSGGHSDIEKQMGQTIAQHSKHPLINLIARTNLTQLTGLLGNALCLISPDSGPAHIATAVNTPVIGLYACTNPDRARPYLSQFLVVNRYPDAILKKYNKSVDQVKWGTRVRDEWAMKLISVDDVFEKFDKLMQASTKTNTKRVL